MKTIQDIKKEREEKQTELFKECGLFWAFSNQQFTENKTPLKEGEKYVSIGAGGYLPKGNLDTFLNGMETLRKWYSAEIKANKGARRANIVYELANYESYYTGSIDNALEALGEEYTRAEVLKVYNEEREANAKLIAHAPELLQMVYDLMKCVKRLTEDEDADKTLEAQWIGEAHELLHNINSEYYKNANA